MSENDFTHINTFRPIMEKPIRGLVLISEGRIQKIDMHSDKGEITSAIEKLIGMRNIIELELREFEKTYQKQFLPSANKVDI